MRPRVVLAGWHGADAERDATVLASMCARLREVRPDLDVVGLGPDPIGTAIVQGVAAAGVNDPLSADAVVQDAVAVVLGGGGPWDDATFSAAGGLAGLLSVSLPGSVPPGWQLGVSSLFKVGLLAVVRRVPLHLHALRFESMQDPASGLVFTHLARSAQSVTAADPASRRWIQGIPGWEWDVPLVTSPADGLETVAQGIPDHGPPPGLPSGRLRLHGRV